MGNPTNPTSAPGLAGAVRPFGAVTIDAPCTPQKVAGQMAFLLPCGGTLTSQTPSPVLAQAQLVDADGNPQGPMQSITLTQGQTYSLATPPSGQQWLVMDISQRQAQGIAAGFLVGTAAVLGFATYGVVELAEHLVHRHRRKVQQRRIARLFD